MSSAPEPRKPRRIRASRARGFRTSTGCLTCRRRRIKCDEQSPKCGQCSKSNRECLYSDAAANGTRQHAEGSTKQCERARSQTSLGSSLTSAGDVIESTSSPAEPSALSQTGVTESVISPSFQYQSCLLESTPYQWYDLLAEEAISEIHRDHSLPDTTKWNFNQISLSRRVTPEHRVISDYRARPNAQTAVSNEQSGLEPPRTEHDQQIPVSNSFLEPSWNTATPSRLTGSEILYMRHYVQYIGPMLDIFDPLRTFSQVVPHLALKNSGLLKSMLAVSARHVSLDSSYPKEAPPQNRNRNQDGTGRGHHAALNEHARAARQYYYETLKYLSQALSIQSYADSHEILATAIMISTFEMLDSNSQPNNDAWERHLKGGFWILRCQDNDGESVDGLRRAVWWAWLRQDTWAAIRAGRPTLTIWHPKQNLEQLNTDQLCTRIVYIAAKVVEYAGVRPEVAQMDIQRRIDDGNELDKALRDWKEILPYSFLPISSETASYAAGDDVEAAEGSESSNKPLSAFAPIWIHPPSHAGAVQTFHFARLILLLHRPTIGGPEAYQTRQQHIDESVDTVCGIASQEPVEVPLAFINMQSLYAASLCLQSPTKRDDLVAILQRTLGVLGLTGDNLINDLRKRWKGQVS